jgi:hypothetical protein
MSLIQVKVNAQMPVRSNPPGIRSQNAKPFDAIDLPVPIAKSEIIAE